ncbi:MAG: GNAT family N-acetyltransferase, partial [Candidatus Promineifilaceae bacterium]
MASTHIQAVQTTNPIRPIQIGRDMPQVMRLLHHVFNKSLDADGRRALDSMGGQANVLMRISHWGSKLAPGFVWEFDNQMVGNVSIIPTQVKGRIIIANVAVHEAYRRRGIARGLMETTLDHLQQVGTRSVLLQVDVDNHGAEHLYRSLGFRDMGSTTFWLASPGQWKELSRDDRFNIRPMRGNEHRRAFEVDSSSYPLDLNWPDPINHSVYRFGFFRVLD